LSFVGIVNNQIIGFVQRRKEIAVLYSTSMSKGQLRKMLFFETFFSNLIASAIAVLASILTTGMLESGMKGMNLYVDIVYNPKLMLMFVGIMFAVLLLTLISPMRKIKKMNVVNEIKYE
jgi:putative ABC transport system permease protein